MNSKTLKALKASIKHWEKMRDDGKVSEPKGENCPLCKLYRVDISCSSCPVMQATGLGHCMRTPYGAAHHAYYHGTDEAWKLAADKEIAFLKSLLPNS